MVCVVSCRYMRISCSEDDHPLFRRYYTRSNRERGVKLLRCFPHCCPEHVKRCYCGSSIHVLVTFAAQVSAVSQQNLVVCARFEPSRVVPLWPINLVDTQDFEGIDDDNERKLQPGEVVSLPETLLSTDKRKAKQTVWIRADREGEVKQKYESAVLFVLNNHRFPKWLYSYNSSITRTQREMTHHLVVYVFQLTGNRPQPGEMEATVLARHESPGFLLVSYRRSGNNSRDAGCDLPAIDVASTSQFTAVDIDSLDVFSSPSADMEIDSVGWPSCEQSTQSTEMEASRWNTHQGQPQFQQKQKHEGKQQQEFRQPEAAGGSSGSAPSSFGVTKDNYSWQHGLKARNCGFREKGQHLLILWRFLQSISLSDLKISTETISEHTRSHWLRTAAILRSPSPNSSRQLNYVVDSFLRGIFEHAFVPPSSGIGIGLAAPLTQESAVLRVTAHLFLRALSSHSVQRLLHSACTLSDAETSKAHLHDRFVLLISDLYDTIGGVLHEVLAQTDGLTRGNQRDSLPALVDEVLSIVCGRPRFRQLRAGVMALLLGQQTTGSLSEGLNCAFQVFTALARERMIASVTRYRTSTRLRYSVARHGDDYLLWNQCWLLEPRSVHILDVSLGTPRDCCHAMRLVDVAQLISAFGCVDITIEDDASWMSLRSTVSVLKITEAAPMTLILDGKLRLFRVLPSGVSSMIATAGGWSVGDYTATFTTDRHALEVNFFSFVEEKPDEFAHGVVRPIGRGTDIYAEVIRLRRVCLLIRLQEEFNSGEVVDSADPRDLFAVVHGTAYGSTYSLPPNERVNGFKLSERPAVDRAATWSEVEWTPLWELQAGYIALPRVGFV